jgi:ribosomal protein S18 acetylase RimI-like enzyme
MDVRKLSRLDGSAFKRLRLEAVQNSPASFARTYEEVESVTVEEFGELTHPSENQVIFGGFSNEELVAIVGLRRESSIKTRHKANIWGVYTSTQYRNRGISRKLLAAAIEEAKSGFEATVLTLAVNVDNLPAKAMYLSFGFCVFGCCPKSLLVDGAYVNEELLMLDVAN